MQQWIESWFHPPVGWDTSYGEWSVLCATSTWMIWKARCKRVFEAVDPNALNIIFAALNYIQLYSTDKPTVAPNTQLNIVRTWSPPPVGFFKINFDASYIINNDHIGIGLVLRDYMGVCRGCKMIPSSSLSAEEAEGMAALEAVKWAEALQLQQVYFEGDAKTIINYLSASTIARQIGWCTKGHLDDIQALTLSFTSVSFYYVPRDVNSVADALASRARASTSEVLSTSPPSFIFAMLNNDCDVSLEALASFSI
ncbi:hypothetical protein BVC80_531g21 [Macleaya cordata]|uniref:RNase H type-1 domain-containing protein n=1 Tax=Macleaya cordata TaxID=56857 RepID=A0A200PMU0_MACCD|nr:hypothetical protein BVC80_531g21 [Macleaya cordata]